MVNSKPLNPGKSKVKSGCRTCKIRKVKCDESFPSCQRCVSTGRVCDGYGIWGGGGKCYGDQTPRKQSKASDVDCNLVRSPSVLLNITSTTEEIRYLDWFKYRTCIKLPGGSGSDLWRSLLFQASLEEKAILHAILALSSTQKRDAANVLQVTSKGAYLDGQEKFSLYQYGKAMKQLQPLCIAQDRAASNIALITCIVFVAMELLRGHFNTAEIHLQYGLRVLDEMQIKNDNGKLFECESSRGWTEDWIIEAFMRLSLQFELFRYSRWSPYRLPQATMPKSSLHSFPSVQEAWRHMDRILREIFHLTSLTRKYAMTSSEPQNVSYFVTRQQDICRDIEVWARSLQQLKERRVHTLNFDQERYYNVLAAYPIMARIMTEVCLWPGDEMQYDLHIKKFAHIMTLMIDLYQITSVGSPIEPLPEHLMDMQHSITDLGWIAPLSYVATKCRNHRIRWQAVRLLESTSHREGIWDAKIMARATSNIIKLEEREFYDTLKAADNFSIRDYPQPKDFLSLTLPKSYRLCDVEIEIEGNPMEKILLYSKQMHTHQSQKALLSEFSFKSQQWENKQVVDI